jgi:arginyl-tRNA synthetase
MAPFSYNDVSLNQLSKWTADKHPEMKDYSDEERLKTFRKLGVDYEMDKLKKDFILANVLSMAPFSYNDVSLNQLSKWTLKSAKSFFNLFEIGKDLADKHPEMKDYSDEERLKTFRKLGVDYENNIFTVITICWHFMACITKCLEETCFNRTC